MATVLRARSLLLAGLPLVLTAALTSGAAPLGGETLHTSVHAYGDHPRQQVTVHWQDRGAPRAGLVILHGGYWARDTDWSTWAQNFALDGYAVFDTDYRLNGDATWAAQRTDVLAALSWARRHADRYAVDPARIAVLGSSAGGHLALTAATHGAGARRTAGVVALSPVASPYRAWLHGGRAGASAADRRLRAEAEKLAGCTPPGTADCRRVWHSLNAASGASGTDDAPMLMLHSADDFVPAAHSHPVAAAERRHGMRAADARVRVVPGRAHGMGLLSDPPVVAEVTDWLRTRTAP